MRIRYCSHPNDAGAMIDLQPSKIIGIGVNYRAHATEMGKALPAQPLMFYKPPSSLLPDGGEIERPEGYARVDYEGELGVVIGQIARRVSRADALNVVMGYTCINDVTVRELQQLDGQFSRAKGFDTFCPMGPRIVGGLDPSNLRITTRIGGVLRQESTTADLIFDVPALIEFVSAHVTLMPGDVISTGTPAGVGPMSVGDEVVIEIEGVGLLRNSVIARS